jgi:PadR family transcriptional regulator, regulatory protein PadR
LRKPGTNYNVVFVHLGDFEQILLFAVLRLGEGAHGGAIRDEIERRIARVVSPGATYTAMDRLEERGFVVSWIGETAPARGGRRRKYYRLTSYGAQALERSYSDLRDMATGLLPRLSALAAEETT